MRACPSSPCSGSGGHAAAAAPLTAALTCTRPAPRAPSAARAAPQVCARRPKRHARPACGGSWARTGTRVPGITGRHGKPLGAGRRDAEGGPGGGCFASRSEVSGVFVSSPRNGSPEPFLTLPQAPDQGVQLATPLLRESQSRRESGYVGLKFKDNPLPTSEVQILYLLKYLLFQG